MRDENHNIWDERKTHLSMKITISEMKNTIEGGYKHNSDAEVFQAKHMKWYSSTLVTSNVFAKM